MQLHIETHLSRGGLCKSRHALVKLLPHVFILIVLPDFNGLFLRNSRDEILREKDCFGDSQAVAELWGMLVNFWQLPSLRSDLVSGPHLQALQVRKDACVFGTLTWGRGSHSQLSRTK